MIISAKKEGQTWLGMSVATAIAAWTSVVAASAVCAILLALSDTVPLALGMPAMLAWHFMIGIGEAAITLAVINFIWRTTPELIYDSANAGYQASRIIDLNSDSDE